MQETGNYKLKKPEGTDIVNIEDLNANTDIIDRELANKAQKEHTHSSYVNQNAFSNVKVGSTTIAADSTTDILTLAAGNNVTLTPDAANDKITISSANTVYTHPTTSGNKHIPSGGSSGQVLKWSADGTAAWGVEKDTVYTHPTHPSKTSGLYKVTIDGTGHVSATSAVTKADITNLGIPAQDTNTTYGVATTGALGLIKSGTDITVDSSGNVSVVDDSHNHVISNVDGLQSALDAKASTSHTHSNYVNQNAFSNVKVGATTIAADSTTDILTLEAGSNVTLTPDATNDKVIISATDTKYSHPYYPVRNATFSKITSDAMGHIADVTPVTKADITRLGIPELSDITPDRIGAFNTNSDHLDNSRDWNTYTTAGQYCVSSCFDLVNKNGPNGGYYDGRLIVFTSKSRSGKNYECVTQLYISYNNNYPLFYRIKEEGYWAGWYKIKDTVYTHPTTHPASMITQDSTHRFVTDLEKNKWNSNNNSGRFITLWTGCITYMNYQILIPNEVFSNHFKSLVLLINGFSEGNAFIGIPTRGMIVGITLDAFVYNQYHDINIPVYYNFVGTNQYCYETGENYANVWIEIEKKGAVFYLRVVGNKNVTQNSLKNMYITSISALVP